MFADDIECPECGALDYTVIAQDTNRCDHCGAVFDDYQDDEFDDALDDKYLKYERTRASDDWDDS